MLSRDHPGHEATETGGLMHTIERRKRIDHNRWQSLGWQPRSPHRVLPRRPGPGKPYKTS